MIAVAQAYARGSGRKKPLGLAAISPEVVRHNFAAAMTGAPPPRVAKVLEGALAAQREQTRRDDAELENLVTRAARALAGE